MCIIRILLICLIIASQIQNCHAENKNVFYLRVATVTTMGDEWASWIANCILVKCEKYNVDPFLAFALFQQESGFNMSAYSKSGAIGIAQLMPETANDLGINPYDAEENIDGGVRYLSYQLENFAWAGEMCSTYAIAAYNAGENAIYKYGDVPPYDETINHVNVIAKIYESLVKEYNQLNL